MAVRDFPSWLRGAMFDSDGVQNLLSAIFDRQNIDLQQELTSVASGDELFVFDVSETGNVKTKKATVSNLSTAVKSAAGLSAYADSRIKSGSFTNDLSVASGTQAVTGVGFQPVGLILFASISGGNQWGTIGSTTGVGVDVSLEFAVGVPALYIQPFATVVRTAAGNLKTGVLSSFDSDGFTMSFTKTGTPTGTQTINYVAFR